MLAAQGYEGVVAGIDALFLGVTQIAVGKTIALVVRQGHQLHSLKNRIERLESRGA